MTRSDATPIFEPLAADGAVKPADHGAGSYGGRGDQALEGVFMLREDGGFVWSSNTRSKSWRLDSRPTAAAYSALARRIIVAGADGALAFLDPETETADIERKVQLSHAVRNLSIFDGGRMALAAGDGEASVIDLAAGHVTLPLRFSMIADQLLLTRTFAYAIDAHNARATLWSLSDLNKGAALPIETSLGRSGVTDAGAVTPFDQFAVASPDGAGIVFASRTDATLYQYAEGMMAPSGSFSNYSRKPVAMMLLDLSLHETEPGKYATTIRHDRGGSYDFLLTGRGPRFSVCARLQMPSVETAVSAAPAYSVTLLSETAADEAAERVIRIRLQQAPGEQTQQNVSGLRDLTMLVFDRYSGWQIRAPMHEIKAGEYEAHVSAPHAGRYDVHVSSVSRDISFIEGRLGQISLGSAP